MPSATIIFSDIVGFSELSSELQVAAVQSLSADVSHELYAFYTTSDKSPSLVTLPTGDGLAVALLDMEENSKWTSTLFGLLYRLARWSQGHHPLRIGVHYGPVAVIRDINGNVNLVGAAINMCQRIMDSAHPNQCLFSEEAQWHYVGRGRTKYSDSTFSENEPIEFMGPYRLVVKHGVSISAYVMYRSGDGIWSSLEPSIRGEIHGKKARANFINTHLAEVRRRHNKPITIYEQSLFSSFGICDDRVMRPGDDQDEEYVHLKERQKALLFELAKEERTTLNLIINTKTRYPPGLMKLKISSLIACLDSPELRDKTNLKVVDLQYEGPNRLIVGDLFLIDGYRLDHTTGYPISMVAYDKGRIDAGIREFEKLISDARKFGKSTRETVELIRSAL